MTDSPQNEMSSPDLTLEDKTLDGAAVPRIDIDFSGRRKGYQIACRLFVLVIVVMFLCSIIFRDAAKDSAGAGVFYFVSYAWLCLFVGGYLGWGRGVVNRLGVLAASPLIGWYAWKASGDPDQFLFQVFAYGIISVMALTGLGMRRWLGELRTVDRGESFSEALQFGIRDVMIWTTVVAAMAAVGKWVVHQGIFDLDVTQGAFSVAGLAAAFSIASIVNVWCFLGQRVSSARLLLLALATACGASICWILMSEKVFVWSVLVKELFLIAFLLLLRGTGIRFAKRNG